MSDPGAAPGIDEKVRFLSTPSAYAAPHEVNIPEAAAPGEAAVPEVAVIETRMSFVFLAGDYAYKLKKPLRSVWLDFRAPEARRANCLEEARLNSRLAPGLYLGVVALTFDGHGFALGGREPNTSTQKRVDPKRAAPEGAAPKSVIVDWLLRMRRLPRHLMLDRMLLGGGLAPDRLEALAKLLASFHASLAPADITPGAYLKRFTDQHARDLLVLEKRRHLLDASALDAVVRATGLFLEREGDALLGRAAEGMVVEGHGDLRPDHICLTDPPVVIDCLEFSRLLRLVDPYEEMACLAMECAKIGAPREGEALLARYRSLFGREPTARLMDFHLAARALLRAQLAMSRLGEPHRAPPGHWAESANTCLRLALEASGRLTAPLTGTAFQ